VSVIIVDAQRLYSLSV